MAKKKTGEQLDLIDVHPKNSKQIIRTAREYKAVQRTRLAALEEEVQKKKKLLDLIRESEVQPLPDGSIKFQLDGITLSVVPRDEKITVKFPVDDED